MQHVISERPDDPVDAMARFLDARNPAKHKSVVEVAAEARDAGATAAATAAAAAKDASAASKDAPDASAAMTDDGAAA